MKTLFSLGILAALGMSVLIPSRYSAPQPTLTIYDTAILMLQEFVKDNQDWDLGFANVDEVMRARIAVDQGIEIYYLEEDSLFKSELPIDSQIIRLGRTVFPVYVGDSLKASITFDSTRGGWY